MKRHQVEHRGLFAERWQAVLAGHRPNAIQPELEKERSVERRLLVVEPRMIRPDRDSGSLRMFHLIRILRDLGWRITFAPDNLLRVEPYVGQLQAIGVEVLYAPFVTSLEAHLSECGELYDAVIASRLEVGRRHMARLRRMAPRAAIIYDTVDLHFVRERREAELLGSQRLLRAAERTRRGELAVATEADATLVVSEHERRILLEASPSLDIFVVSNIHRQFESSVPFEDRRGILFIGGFQHPPNIDAVRWLVSEIVPALRELGVADPIYVVGSHPPAEIRALAHDDVEVTGFVEDVAPYFARCRLSVAPLRYGAGVKGKINQSMAHGLPVVATSMACEGMELEDRRDVLIADEPDSFARAIVELSNDRDLWRRLVEGGRRNIEAHYSVAAARDAISRVLEFVAGRRPGQSDVKPVWTPAQAAAYLKISRRRLLAAAERGEVPHAVIAGKVRFPSAELEAWVRREAKRTTQPKAVIGPV